MVFIGGRTEWVQLRFDPARMEANGDPSAAAG
jgi:hypothetical protein